ncbi:MAG: copper homeostasis protein CutC [Flammeovirgaceae bacterium]|nr:copper homeostasis protein CutC [Flammeovirgaceae bacterium]
MKPILLEVVAYNFATAQEAHRCGADRIELCDNPHEGGTTPSYGTIEMCRKHINTDLFVMIRPRGGDFLYTLHEIDIMKKDIMMCKRLGIDGVVLGVLTSVGTINTKVCEELIQLARPMQVTCHRAFDMTVDLMHSLEDCIGVGFDRILTSGGATKVMDGLTRVEQLMTNSNGRIIIMPGSGIDDTNVVEVIRSTRAGEIHLSSSKMRESEMTFRNGKLAGLGTSGINPYDYHFLDREKLIRVKEKAIEAAALAAS